MVGSVDTENSNKGDLRLQGLKYAIGCAFTLVLKVAVASLIGLWLTPVLAYLVVHAFIFFVSYAIHSRFTFSVPWKAGSLVKYFKAVSLFKVFDFAMFTFLSASCGMNTTLGIVIASALALAARFMLIRNALFASAKQGEVAASKGLLHGSWAALQGKWNCR